MLIYFIYSIRLGIYIHYFFDIFEKDDWCESPIYTESSSEIKIDHITNNDQWHPATQNSPISLILRPNMDSVAISIGEHEIHLFFRDIRYTKLSNFGEITINLNRDYEKKTCIYSDSKC